MSVLNRKLFNRGGKVSSRGVGITSGLAAPVRGYKIGGGVVNPEVLEANRIQAYQKQDLPIRFKVILIC